jgi:hypothetical protein
VGIGILVCLAFLISDRPIGCSTAFLKASGMIGKIFRRRQVEAMEYYRLFAPRLDWQFMIVPGIVIGAFLSAVLSGTFLFAWVPGLWEASFGGDPVPRVAAALAGGILLGIGARWAGGCTSGHGISGTAQLSVASVLSAACFFAGGIATAIVLVHLAG